MISKINSRLNEYLEFDNNLLFVDKFVRIFGGAIRDSIADQPINDIDILCAPISLRMIEDVLLENGYIFIPKASTFDIVSLYSTINIISEPKTWMKGNKMVQLIKPRIIQSGAINLTPNEYFNNFKELIQNVDLSCCGVSYARGILYQNYRNAILHCIGRKFHVNYTAKMYNSQRAEHRIGKLIERGWEKIKDDKVDNRNLLIDEIFSENYINLEYVNESLVF